MPGYMPKCIDVTIAAAGTPQTVAPKTGGGLSKFRVALKRVIISANVGNSGTNIYYGGPDMTGSSNRKALVAGQSDTLEPLLLGGYIDLAYLLVDADTTGDKVTITIMVAAPAIDQP